MTNVMSKVLRVFVVVIILQYYPLNVSGYELGTHSRVVYHAYIASDLFLNNELLLDMGLTNTHILGDIYFDVDDLTVKGRFASEFVLRDEILPKLSNDSIENEKSTKTTLGWLMRGAVREDNKRGR